MNNSFKIQVQNLDPVLKNLNRIAKEKEQEIKAELDAFGLLTVGEAQNNVRRDRSILVNRISHKLNGLTVEIIVASNYAAYVEFGTRKFAAAHVATLPADWQAFAAKFKGKTSSGDFELLIERITEWIRRTGYLPIEAAYNTAKKIAIEGSQAHPFLYPSYVNQKKALIANLKKLF